VLDGYAPGPGACSCDAGEQVPQHNKMGLATAWFLQGNVGLAENLLRTAIALTAPWIDESRIRRSRDAHVAKRRGQSVPCRPLDWSGLATMSFGVP
jgi:hypothetical protein